MSFAQGTIFRFLLLSLLSFAQSAAAIGFRELWSWAEVQGNPTISASIDDRGDLIHVLGGKANTVVRKHSGRTGVPIWQRSLPFYFPRYPKFALDPAGDAYVMGRPNETHLLKISGESGTVLWEKSYLPGSLTNAFGQLLLVTTNDVLILATTQNLTNDYCNVRKYSALDGALLWEAELHQVNGSAAMAVGMNGDVSVGVVKDNNFHVVKLSSANGSLLWASTLVQTNRADLVHRVTLDNQGNVFLVGDGFGRMYVAKLAAEDGSLIWERYHSEDSDSQSIGTIIQMDNGDVVTWAWVWFQTDGFNQNGIYVARLRGTDGSLLWKRRFEPTLPARSLSLHLPGMIKSSDDHLVFLAVTLSISAAPDSSQIFKIDGVTGKTLWELVPDWPDVFAPAAFAVSSDRLALTSASRTAFFQIGPELQTRLFDDQLEISWEKSNLGWQLDSSTFDLTSWSALDGSTATNLIRINRNEPSRFFRLIR